MQSEIIQQSLMDLKEDFEELLYLFSSSLKQLQTFQKDIKRQKEHMLSFETLLKTAKEYEKRYKEIIKELKEIPGQARNDKANGFWTSQNDVLEKRLKYYDLYRSLQSIVAGLITSTDWQSPTFAHSLMSLAGRQSGKIKANYTDYKRDHHLDANIYAENFRNEYVNGFLKFPIHTYLVNSGMAALTTILNFLEMERKITGPILLGSSSYFQNKELIKRLFIGITEIHEHETEKIKEFIQTKHPSVLFFDSLCNSYDIAVPDLSEIIKILRSAQNDRVKRGFAPEDIYIIIDNTCLAASFQPLQLMGKFSKNIHMIVFESMNKYYQFGLDKTMGGIIYAWGKDTGNLYLTRRNSGTIISDFSCYLLPTPNKKLLQKRLARHERNAKLLTDSLTKYLQDNPKTPLQDVVYPTLHTHPAQQWAKNLSFHGSFFTFVWKPKYDTIRSYKKFIANVLTEAKKTKIQIVQGTSFGMNNSRIYLTASNTKFGKPFVRFSVGTETRIEIEKIKDVLIAALEKL